MRFSRLVLIVVARTSTGRMLKIIALLRLAILKESAVEVIVQSFA